MAKAPRLLLVGIAALMGTAPVSLAGAEGVNAAGTVTAVAGPVTVARFQASSHPLKFRDTLYWRDVIEAQRDGIARVLLGGKTTVTVRELSRLELREEAVAEGIRYSAELVAGKVRASVARMLMRPGDEVEVRTRNVVASVRGTDFIVETAERPAQGRPFGLLGAREVVQAVLDGGNPSVETVVVTLSGIVLVSNPLVTAGRRERIGAYEAVRVSGGQDPARFQITAGDLRVLLQGLTPPRPSEARSGDRAEAVGRTIERAALAASSQSVPLFGNAGGKGNSPALGPDGDQGSQSGSQAGRHDSQSVGPALSNGQASGSGSTLDQGNGNVNGNVNGNGLALGQANGKGQGNGLALGHGDAQGSVVPPTPAAQVAGPGNGQGYANRFWQSRGVVNALPAPSPAVLSSGKESAGTLQGKIKK